LRRPGVDFREGITAVALFASQYITFGGQWFVESQPVSCAARFSVSRELLLRGYKRLA
jgi:hypothetical protein